MEWAILLSCWDSLNAVQKIANKQDFITQLTKLAVTYGQSSLPSDILALISDFRQAEKAVKLIHAAKVKF